MRMQNRNFPRPIGGGRRTRGMALLDILMYTALVALALYGVFVLAQKVFGKSAVNEEAQQFLEMSNDTAMTFAKTQGNFAGVTVAQLLAHNLVPKKMINGTSIQTAAWSTPVTVAPASLTGSTADALSYTYSVPRTECSDFVTTVAGALGKVTVGGTTIKDVANGVPNVNMTALGTSCNATAGTGNVALVLTRGR